jgi:acyl carrier protein
MTATPARTSEPAGQAVLQIIARLRPHHRSISDHTTLGELGFDSLDRLALAVAIEGITGVAIADTVLPQLRTVADVIDIVMKGDPL